MASNHDTRLSRSDYTYVAHEQKMVCKLHEHGQKNTQISVTFILSYTAQYSSTISSLLILTVCDYRLGVRDSVPQI